MMRKYHVRFGGGPGEKGRKRCLACGLPNNLRFNGEPIVIVLGDAPPAILDEWLRKVLSAGTPATLPQDVIVMLHERSIREREKGPWREGHYDPGKRLI